VMSYIVCISNYKIDITATEIERELGELHFPGHF